MRTPRTERRAKRKSVIGTDLGKTLPSLRDSVSSLVVDQEAVTELCRISSTTASVAITPRPHSMTSERPLGPSPVKRTVQSVRRSKRSALVPVLSFICGVCVAILAVVAAHRHPRAAAWAGCIQPPSRSAEDVVKEPAAIARSAEVPVTVNVPVGPSVPPPASSTAVIATTTSNAVPSSLAPIPNATVVTPRPAPGAARRADKELIVKKRAPTKKAGKSGDAEAEFAKKVFESGLAGG